MCGAFHRGSSSAGLYWLIFGESQVYFHIVSDMGIFFAPEDRCVAPQGGGAGGLYLHEGVKLNHTVQSAPSPPSPYTHICTEPLH